MSQNLIVKGFFFFNKAKVISHFLSIFRGLFQEEEQESRKSYEKDWENHEIKHTQKNLMSIPEEPDTHLTEAILKIRHCSLIPAQPFDKIIFSIHLGSSSKESYTKHTRDILGWISVLLFMPLRNCIKSLLSAICYGTGSVAQRFLLQFSHQVL